MLKTRIRWLLALTLGPALAGCDAGEGGPVVAQAAGHELTVADVTNLMSEAPQVPNQPQVVSALANLWVDYTLLAVAASEDSTLANVDLSPLIDQRVEQEAILALADSMIRPDTAVSEEELRSIYDREGSQVEIHARHLLLSVPQGASQTQRDSVRVLAEELQQRAAQGEDFAALAREYSDDQASAVQGGDLGWFSRGQMVPPFDEAAFALEEPGDVSEVVETPFGLHVIKLEERRSPEFEEVQAEFRAQVQQQRYQEAESVYLAQVEEPANMEVGDEAVEMVRQVARDPQLQLSDRAARRAMVTYEGGEVTLGEIRDFMQTRQPQFLDQVNSAEDEAIEEGILQALAQRELLVQEAGRLDLGLPQAQQDSLIEDARVRFAQAARDMDLAPITPEEGESRDEAIQRTVEEMLRGIVRQERQATPLGAIAFTLRQQYPNEIHESVIDQAVERVAAARDTAGAGAEPPTVPGQPAPGAEDAPPAGAGDAAPGDTSGATGGAGGGATGGR